MSYQIIFFDLFLPVQFSHPADFFLDRITQFHWFDNLDIAAVFQDFPYDFDKSGNWKTQAQTAIFVNGNLLRLVPFLLGDQRRDFRGKAQRHVLRANSRNYSEIAAESRRARLSA